MAHPKSELVERCKDNGLSKPSYTTTNTGSEHDTLFISEVAVDGVVIGEGQGKQKRSAEREAAKAGLAYLDETDNRVGEEAMESEPVDPEDPFEGPWPIFPEVLSSSLTIANSRVNVGKTGQEAIHEVRDLTLSLYKEVLEHLGEVVDLEDDETDEASKSVAQ